MGFYQIIKVNSSSVNFTSAATSFQRAPTDSKISQESDHRKGSQSQGMAQLMLAILKKILKIIVNFTNCKLYKL